jgi:hypothetical protein
MAELRNVRHVSDEEAAQLFAEKVCEHQFAAVLSTIKELKVDTTRIERVFETAQHESDRACCILVGALIDDLISDAFKRELRSECTKGTDSLLASFAALGSGGARSRLTFALRWISIPANQMIDRVRRLRNDFAHNIEAVDFEKSAIRDRVMSMRDIKQSVFKNIDLGKNLHSSKDHFLARSSMLAGQLSLELIINPTRQRFGIPNEMILFKDLPTHLQAPLMWTLSFIENLEAQALDI